MGEANDGQRPGEPTSALAAAWQRLGRIDERTTSSRAFWLGFVFLIVSGVWVTIERFAQTTAGVMPLIGLAVLALSLGDLVRRTTPTALARLVAGALVVVVFIAWATDAG